MTIATFLKNMMPARSGNDAAIARTPLESLETKTGFAPETNSDLRHCSVAKSEWERSPTVRHQD